MDYRCLPLLGIAGGLGLISLPRALAADMSDTLNQDVWNRQVRGAVVVRFRLKPGEAAVTLRPEEEREVERIPEQLRRFF